MIVIDDIRDKFLTIAQDTVGDLLSKQGINGDEPCVIFNKPNAPDPSYPYITIETQDVSDENEWLINEYINDDNLTVYENFKTILISYTCYGGESSTSSPDKSIDIMNKFHSSFRFETIRNDIRSSLNGSIVSLSTVENFAVPLKDKIIDSASFNVLFNILDSIEDPNSNIIDTVSVLGDVYSIEGDISSDQININITSN